jgi:glycosyltransferase involved in cell wall biosynthesis
MEEYRISIVVPCFERPQRTRRIIGNILSQTINNWEAFVIGDGCPHFQKMIDSGEVNGFIKEAESKGNKLHCYNLSKNHGGWGYHITNYATENAKGKYMVFAGNDDIILENHFEHYLSEIEKTELDLVYYRTFVATHNFIRDPELKKDRVGHSELIVRTDIIRDIKHHNEYAHDWSLIEEIIKKGAITKKAISDKITYIITHSPGITIDTID